MPKLICKARYYIFPVKASVSVVSEEFRKKGDVNLDGRIDDKDVDVMRKAYGSTPGSPNWNPLCDLNDDGKVDIRDTAILARHYGESAPEEQLALNRVTPFEVELPAGLYCALGTYKGSKVIAKVTLEEANTKTVVFVYSLLGFLTRPIVR